MAEWTLPELGPETFESPRMVAARQRAADQRAVRHARARTQAERDRGDRAVAYWLSQRWPM